jgi:hypothetical protein
MPKPFKPTKQQREDVERNVAAGITEDGIAHMLGITRFMLRYHFAEQLQFGRDRKLAAYMALLEQAAADLNVSAIKRLIDIAGGHIARRRKNRNKIKMLMPQNFEFSEKNERTRTR